MAAGTNALAIHVGSCQIRGNERHPFWELVEAVASYVFEDGSKPQELRQAQNIQRWGDPFGKGWIHWPVGMLDKCNAALNLHDICQSWQAVSGENQGEWMKRNPKAWKHIISPLMERQLKDGKSESWL